MRLARSLRFRTAAVAAAVVTVALVVSAVALVVLTRRSLTEAARTDAVAQAQLIAELAAIGIPQDALPTAGSGFGQLVADDGTVIAETRSIDIERPITTQQAVPGEQLVFEVAEIEDTSEDALGADDGRFVVAVIGVATAIGPAQAVAAASLSEVANATRVMVPLLIIGIPLLAALVFVTALAMVGRSLAPIEAMRAEADAISISDLGRRINDPGSRDEVGRLAETLNSMLTRLESSIVRQRRFVADASHELRSPVAALVTMAEVARANPAAVSQQGLAADVAIEANRLALLTDDLLALARSDEGELELELRPIDVAEIIAQEIARLSVEVDTTGVVSSIVRVDRLRLGQAIRNLLDNALRHATSSVWVATSVQDAVASIIVADDGPGVPVADRSRVFERFQRLDEARDRDRGGSGLGLAVVKTIVEAHRGSVAVIDDPAYPGAVFRVELPV